MADRIKGITVEIGGDTTGLKKALESVNKNIRNTQSQLKDVNKLLKLDPSNTELLSQKHKLLKDAVSETTEKLDALKEAQRQAKEQLENGTLGQDKYDALAREVIETEQNLKSLKAESKQFGSVFSQQMQIAGQKVKEVGDKISKAGEGITKNVTGPIMAVGGASLAAWKQMDEGLDTVVKKTGATGDELKEFESIVKDLGKTIPTSFAVAGEAVGEVNTRFGVTGQQLQDLSEAFIKFADINDTDVTSSVDNVQKAMSAYGLKAEDTGHMLDLLTSVAQKTGVSVDKLETGIVQNATAFQEMGLSVDQAATLMGQMEKSGANSETVMNGLRKALKNASKDGTDMNTALKKLQKSIAGGKDDMEGLKAAYDMFGKSGDQIYGAIKAGTLDFTKLGDTAVDCGGLVSQTFEETKSPAENFQTALNTLIELGYEIGNAIMPTIQSVLEQVIPVIQTVTDAWNSLDDEQKDFIVKAALVVAAIGPVITIIGSVISILGTAMSALGAVTGFLGGPLTIAIAAAIAVGVLLYKNWDTIREKAGELWKTVSEKFEKIRSAISEKIKSAKEKVRGAIEAIKGFFNFKIEWPHIPLPHFKVSGSANPLSWLEQGVPKISIDWYRKAMDKPYVLDGATIFGAMGHSLLGGGEAGKEVILGLDKLKEYAGSRVMNVDIVVNAAPGQSETAIAKEVSRQLQNEVMRKKAVWK